MANSMTAQVATPPRTNGKNYDGDKERVATLTLVGVVDGAPVELAQARFWMSRSADGAGPLYCSIWTHHGWHTAGHGVARGCGYHKQSAALDFALDSAGIRLYQPAREAPGVSLERARIDGVGDAAMRDAMLALGVALGHKRDALAVLS